ncbi:MAG TPA: hypothetical protein VIU33_03870 [Nitrospiria bacterium]
MAKLVRSCFMTFPPPPPLLSPFIPSRNLGIIPLMNNTPAPVFSIKRGVLGLIPGIALLIIYLFIISGDATYYYKTSLGVSGVAGILSGFFVKDNVKKRYWFYGMVPPLLVMMLVIMYEPVFIPFLIVELPFVMLFLLSGGIGGYLGNLISIKSSSPRKT